MIEAFVGNELVAGQLLEVTGYEPSGQGRGLQQPFQFAKWFERRGWFGKMA